MTLKTPSPSVFPRKYRQILKHQEYKANTVKQPKKPQSSIRPNEAFKEFAQRIDNECRQLINIEARKSSKTLLKRTTWLKNKRKKKLKE